MEPAAARFLRSRPDERGGGAEEQSRSQLEHEHEEDQGEESPCVLDIFVHEARGIHNICIYGDQDVYARLALTSAPDDDGAALATRVARGGGASPRFGERLPPLRVRQGRIAVDVLKCELWMRSCARGVLDDQLLGFALVPLASVAAADGARIVEGNFELSSTDLLHSPAGTVRLSLALRPGIPEDDACAQPPGRGADAEPSIASEVVILGPAPAPPVDYSRIEFTDLRVEQENDAMAVQYLPFLPAGDGVVASDYCEMSTSPRGDASAASSDGSTSRNASASTASTVSEDRAVSSSAEAAEKPLPLPDLDEATTAPLSCRSPDTPTSRGGKATKADVFTSPLGDMDMDIDMEAEQSAMQRQIMEMYVKSMQQFSESLAKMQLPIELGLDGGGGGGGVVVQKEETPDKNKVIERQQAKKDGTRVFYGSRAFF
ncbi:unnamed protein product [Miscanthus lutarioriparius]|uniref:C2 domain-containing protein n=1 Tax=Miscanthus lutarioriparius TaxID=422564 RepID=A0A811P7X2_9POAL|nr:unnamed protein product [Miscanthus lutarioriparius]